MVKIEESNTNVVVYTDEWVPLGIKVVHYEEL